MPNALNHQAASCGLAWPDAEKQQYADEHRGGWGEYLDRLATVLAKRQPG